MHPDYPEILRNSEDLTADYERERVENNSPETWQKYNAGV